MYPSLPRLRNNTLIFPRPDILYGALEVALGPLQCRIRAVLVGLQIRVDELDQAVQVLGRDGIILLVEVVDVAIEDLNKELHRHGRIHTGVCDTESALEAFEDALAVAVELELLGKRYSLLQGNGLTFCGSSSPLCGFSITHQRWLARYTARHWSGFLSSLLPCSAALVISVS